MSHLDVSIHVKRQAYDIGLLGVKEYKHELSAKSRHAFIRTDWFGSFDHLDPKFFLESNDPENSKPVRKPLGQRLRKAARVVSEIYQESPNSIPDETSQPMSVDSSDENS